MYSIFDHLFYYKINRKKQYTFNANEKHQRELNTAVLAVEFYFFVFECVIPIPQHKHIFTLRKFEELWKCMDN